MGDYEDEGERRGRKKSEEGREGVRGVKGREKGRNKRE